MSTTFWATADRFPPILCRLLARRPYGPPLTDAEIAAASGIPIVHVFAIGQSTTWHGIDLPTMRKFLTGCGMDFEDFNQISRARNYLRHKPSWKYLRVSPQWRTMYEPLMRKYRQSILKASVTTDSK